MLLVTNALLVHSWRILTRLIIPSTEAVTANLDTLGKLLIPCALLARLLWMKLNAGPKPALVIIMIITRDQINAIFAPIQKIQTPLLTI
jgi:hypothetical protein